MIEELWIHHGINNKVKNYEVEMDIKVDRNYISGGEWGQI